jgi:hypothetical protein
MSAIRTLLLVLSAIGGSLFGLIFAVSLLNPGYVEQVAKELIRSQVEKKVHEKFEAIDAKFLSSKAATMVKKYGEKVTLIKRQLSEKLPERIAAVIAEMQNLDCECRKKVEKEIRSGFEWQIANATEAQERLTVLIRNQYMETSAKLTREFRIFTGTNALVFLFLGIAALVKPRAWLHLLPAATVLLVAAGLTSYLYLFNQNWLHTIVFSDYVGFAFIGYLAAVFAFLCDILFNRARVTTELLNGLFNAVGSALQVAPC